MIQVLHDMNRANPVPVGTEPYFKALGGAREAAMPEKRQRLTADCRFSAALEGGGTGLCGRQI